MPKDQPYSQHPLLPELQVQKPFGAFFYTFYSEVPSKSSKNQKEFRSTRQKLDDGKAS